MSHSQLAPCYSNKHLEWKGGGDVGVREAEVKEMAHLKCRQSKNRRGRHWGSG